MVIEFLNFWMCYWVLAYGPFVGSVMIVGSILAGISTWVKLVLPW